MLCSFSAKSRERCARWHCSWHCSQTWFECAPPCWRRSVLERRNPMTSMSMEVMFALLMILCMEVGLSRGTSLTPPSFSQFRDSPERVVCTAEHSAVTAPRQCVFASANRTVPCHQNTTPENGLRSKSCDLHAPTSWIRPVLQRRGLPGGLQRFVPCIWGLHCGPLPHFGWEQI